MPDNPYKSPEAEGPRASRWLEWLGSSTYWLGMAAIGAYFVYAFFQLFGSVGVAAAVPFLTFTLWLTETQID